MPIRRGVRLCCSMRDPVLDDLAEPTEVGDGKRRSSGCRHAASKGWLIVQDDADADHGGVGGGLSIRNWFADRQAHGSDRP